MTPTTSAREQGQRVGDQRDGELVDIAELVLQGVQDRQRRPGKVLQTIDERAGAGLIPDLMRVLHRYLPFCSVIRSPPL